MSASVSRRVTLAWIAAASTTTALATAGCDSESPKGPQIGRWKDIALEPLTAPGYGQDPNLVEPVTPWPLTLKPSQRKSLRIAADLMLPADSHSPSGAALHLDAFIDEWISAPYPVMQADRSLIVSGLAWLDAESAHKSGKAFAQASDAQRRTVFDTVAFKDKVQPDYVRPAEFFVRLRSLMIGGFYSLPEGMKDIGYMGNAPSVGEYPGPTPEALAHLNAVLAKLNLKPV
jgi:hypothetical protein